MLYLKALFSRIESDGLNSVKYNLVKTEKHNLFTRFYVSYKDK